MRVALTDEIKSDNNSLDKEIVALEVISARIHSNYTFYSLFNDATFSNQTFNAA